LIDFVDEDGAITFQLRVKIYLINTNEENAKTNKIVTDTATTLVPQEKIEKACYHFRDESTSDVTFSVLSEDKRSGRDVLCHSAVLSGVRYFIDPYVPNALSVV